LGRVLLDVDVGERHLALFVVVAGCLGVGAAVLAVDRDHAINCKTSAVETFEKRPRGVGQRHRLSRRVVVGDHDSTADGDRQLLAGLDNLISQREAGSPDRRNRQPDLELVAEMRRRAVIALGPRDDDARVRRGRPGLLAPERQPALLEIREVDRMIHVTHRVTVAEPHAQPVTIDVRVRHSEVEYPTTVGFPATAAESFNADEVRALAPYFTNTDRPVFALTNLPETVKGALFARYSRSAKSVRRLFLDEFLGQIAPDAPERQPREGRTADSVASSTVGTERADRLYARVLSDYGDDSVAQLGGAHLACEGVSNVVTKVLEWGRLMAYLEQSTRYVPYTDRPNGRWKYHVPAELDSSPLRDTFVRTLDHAFDTYARWIAPMEAHFRSKYPKAPDDSEGVYKSVIRAKALDTLRGLLPAATSSNVGLFGTGQAFETLLLRMFAHPLEEVRGCGRQMLTELRHVIPAFLARLDQPNRGGRWIDYFAETRRAFEA